MAVAIDGVFGVDERVQVSTTSVPPGSMTVLLIVQWANGEFGGCSGFMVGPRTVGTAGHCIYSHADGGWPAQVLAVPGANGAERPFGQSWAVSVQTVSGWADYGDFRFDYGSVTLADDIGFASGTFALTAATDELLLSSELTATGYSQDKPPATMWQASGYLDDLDGSLLYSRIDVTYGNSGGPLWLKTDADEHYVVGIVSSGTPVTNLAVRVNSVVFQQFVNWANLAPTDAPSGEPTAEPPAGAAPSAGTVTLSPSSVSGERGELALAIVAVGAHNGLGDLTVTTSGGGLIANAFLTPASCGAGAAPCMGVPEDWTTTLTIPDATNDLGGVFLTLGGTIEGSTSVMVTVSQGGTTWATELQVILVGEDGMAPFTAYGTRVAPGQTIEAVIDGVVCGSTTADADGNWILYVRSTDPCAPSAGATIRFHLNGELTPASEEWTAGGAPADVANGVDLEVTDHADDHGGGFVGELAVSGVSLVSYGGGSLEQMAHDALLAGITAIAATADGQTLAYIVGAPAFVNAGFASAFPGGLPAATIVLVRR